MVTQRSHFGWVLLTLNHINAQIQFLLSVTRPHLQKCVKNTESYMLMTHTEEDIIRTEHLQNKTSCEVNSTSSYTRYVAVNVTMAEERDTAHNMTTKAATRCCRRAHHWATVGQVD